MANHHPHPSPPIGMQMHHGPPGAPPPPQGSWLPSRNIAQMNEAVWYQIGHFSETLGQHEEAMAAYERALHANPQSIQAMMAISMVLRAREEFPKAAEYLQAVLKLENTHGDAWGSLGHCFLMMDDLQQAYAAYQNAVVNLTQPKDPRLWYGIGILYDRYGSLEHAEEAFSNVMQMQPDFEKAHEIYFRLGIIYKQQQKYSQSLECFNYIVNSPPAPLTQEDIWFQIGHVHEQQKDYDNAKAAYTRVLERDPNHAKVLQQLGWLYHQSSPNFEAQERAIDYLEKSVAADNTDAQSWYLLGRCYMGQQKYPKAYEAYQQAVYRDGRNPTFWCSIGVLYYQINQYRDALDAYSRAIRLNPFISEVWYDLGTLYESCNNQINDALDAYQRAAELDPGNPHIKARLQLLQNGQTNGAPPQAPVPTDVHPNLYQPSGAIGPPGPQWAGSAPAPQQQPPQPPNGPPPGPHGWTRINDINPPPQPPNPYGADREPFRGGAPLMPRQSSPRSEQQLRPYPAESNRGPELMRGPEPLRRGPSPTPQPQQQQQQQHYPPPLPPQQGRQPPPVSQAPPVRMQNPNYGGQTNTMVHPSPGPPPVSGLNGLPPPNAMMNGPYRTNSPMTTGRPPMHDARMPSPKSAYPQHQPPYPPHPEQASPNGPEQGPPHSSHPSMPGESAMHRHHDPRPPSVPPPPKRLRDWEDDREPKKPASDENRARLEDMRHRRPSTPPRETYRRNSSEARRFEEARRMEDKRHAEEQRRAEDMRRAEEQQRHAQEGYHPSDAAHHHPGHSAPPHLPSMNQGPSQHKIQSMLHEGPPAGLSHKDYSSQEERTRPEHPPPSHASAAHEPERAARKIDVNENYDDSDAEDKKVPISAGPASGPGSSGEMKNGTPTGASINS